MKLNPRYVLEQFDKRIVKKPKYEAYACDVVHGILSAPVYWDYPITLEWLVGELPDRLRRKKPNGWSDTTADRVGHAIEMIIEAIEREAKRELKKLAL